MSGLGCRLGLRALSASSLNIKTSPASSCRHHHVHVSALGYTARVLRCSLPSVLLGLLGASATLDIGLAVHLAGQWYPSAHSPSIQDSSQIRGNIIPDLPYVVSVNLCKAGGIYLSWGGGCYWSCTGSDIALYIHFDCGMVASVHIVEHCLPSQR